MIRNDKNERQIIEDYLSLHCIEDLLDETINTIVDQRPQNPCLEMSRIIASKSMPEILKIRYSSVLIAGMDLGIEAIITTNLGDFKGVSVYKDKLGQSVFLKEFTYMEDLVSSFLKDLDPRDTPKIDETLEKNLKDEPSILLATSIAAYRAAASARGIPLFKYIAEVAGTEMVLPLPVATVVTRSAGNLIDDAEKIHQILAFPSASTDLHQALESLTQLSLKIRRVIRENPSYGGVTDNGAFRINVESLEKALKIMKSAANTTTDSEPALDTEIKFGVDLHSEVLSTDAVSGGASTSSSKAIFYHSEVPGVQRSGSEVVEAVIGLVKDYEIVSVEQPVVLHDPQTVRALREKIKQLMDAAQVEGSSKLSYNLAGVGGQQGVSLQVVLDSAAEEDIRLAANDALFNAFRLTLSKTKTVSRALALCKAARAAGLSVIVGVNRDLGESNDSFLADLAVGVGAGQIMAGGFLSGDYICKYNRLLDISKEDSSIAFVGSYFRR